MRKMYSENQIKDIVNKGIEDGSIHADPSTEVKVGDINSESQTAGKVIVSDGEGGAEWGTIQAGTDVVTLESSSGTLSADDLVKAKTNNCIIVYGGMYHYKLIHGANIIYTSNPVPSSTSLTEDRIKINATTGVYVVEKMWTFPNVIGYEGTSLLPTDVVFENWTLHRAIKIGNILWVILCGVIKNTTASTFTQTNLFSITLPSDISSKIYRADGTTCDSNYSSDVNVATQPGATGAQSNVFRLCSEVANVLYLDNTFGTTIPANDSKFVNVRIPIFLDIGD